MKPSEMLMIVRHMNELMNLLEEVWEVGIAKVRQHRLLVWFERDRMGNMVWVEIAQLWEEVCDGEAPLLIGETEGKEYVFVWGAGLETDNSWLIDVRNRATGKK